MENLVNTINDYVNHCLSRCQQCGECLNACPLMHPEEGIKDLNQIKVAALNYYTSIPLKEIKVHDKIIKFVKECMQCGKCRNVCPVFNFRDVMVLWQKYQLKDASPVIQDHFQFRGGVQSVVKNIGINIFSLFKGLGMKDLAKHVDKKDIRKSDTLFYFGCYIFSPTGLPAKTLQLANYLGMDYEVIGGLRSCCGWPQYLGGDLERSEELFDNLHSLINKVNPKRIITGCGECYASIWRLKNTRESSFETLTTSQWILMNKDKFNLSKGKETFTFHDACHITRKIKKPEDARAVLKEMGNLVELEFNREESLCCGYYQQNINPQQVKSLRVKKLAMAKATGAKKMAVECVTCLESFHPLAKEANLEILDVVDIVHQKVISD